jgi:16S rRNA (guanine527-N7)-methyltransferase
MPSARSTSSDSHARRSFSSGSGTAGSAAPRGSAAPADAPVDPAPPAALRAAAATIFGDRLAVAERYAELLMTDGVVRGLIGPRETPRIWDRHLLNCAVVADLIPQGATVVDVGSGAGLPGIVLSIARPDLTVILLEPLARRTAFLTEAVADLKLDAVSVVRARAEECVGRGMPAGLPADIVTARAVAPLDRLAGWCLPLAVLGGRMLALKGASAADEVATHAPAVERLGGGRPTIHLCGEGLVDEPATVIEVVRERVVGGPPPRQARADRPERGGATNRGGRRR